MQPQMDKSSPDINIWMPLYLGEFVAETMQFSTEETGAYTLLLISCWRNGYIRNDPKTLKLITKISAKKLNAVLLLFYEENGRLYHKKLEQYREQAIENKSKKIKQTIAARAARKKNIVSVTDSVTKPVTEVTTPIPTTLPTYIHQLPEQGVLTGGESTIQVKLPEWLPLEEWNSYCEMINKSKNPLNERSARFLISQLEKFRDEGYSVKKTIQNAISNSKATLIPIR